MIAYILTRATPRFKCKPLVQRLGLQPCYVCDTSIQADSLTVQHGIPSKQIVVAPKSPGPPYGSTYLRHWVCTELAAHNEWFAWLDDNVSGLTGIPPSYSTDKLNLNLQPRGTTWRELFTHELTRGEAWYYIEETINLAEELGTIDCGFATEENFYFRARKWQHFGYCRSQFGLYKNDGSSWLDGGAPALEDFSKSIDVVSRYGCVVINRHLKPSKTAFEAGGIGSFEQRLPILRSSCRWLMEHYPGLLTYSKGRDYHLTFAKRSFKSVAEWRRKNGYLD